MPAEFKKNGRPRKLWIPPGIVIPHFEGGRLQRIRVRRPEGEPRYYVVPGSSMATMTLGDVRRAAVVVESELDGILLHHRAGDLARVVALGSSAAKPDARATALLREAALILVALDFDKAGAQASPWWKQNFPQSKLWPPPVGKDPGEAYSKHGVDLAAWLRAGFPEGWTVGQALCSPPGLQGAAALRG